MEPDEFMTREQFEALHEAARARYMVEFMDTLAPMLEDGAADEGRKLDYLTHYFDVLEWVTPPEEYDRTVKSRFWDLTWERAQELREKLAEARDNPELDEAERARVPELLDFLDAMIEHKRNIDDLPG